MHQIFSHFSVFTLIHIVFVIGITWRVIMRRPPASVAFAWLFLVAIFPLGGALIYLLIGEQRIGRQRTTRIQQLREEFSKVSQHAISKGLVDVDWSRHSSEAFAINSIGRNIIGTNTLQGSRYQLFSDTQEILQQITADVDRAQTSVLMEFYIWNEGGNADKVLDAVIRAAERGVSCRLLIDALGASAWWKGKQPQQLRDAGVELHRALPVGVFRTLIGRTDLRLHRKIVVIDGAVAWTGSMNLVDPRYFKQGAGVGEWVDAMARFEGAVVVSLAATMVSDWLLETGETLQAIVKSAGLKFAEPDGTVDIQVIPSGPGYSSDGLLQMVLALIYAAKDELVLTTPYLAPDASVTKALRGAAARGVKVSLIVPEKVDSLLTRYASRSYYDELFDTGVEIHLYKGGLLHTKSITVDQSITMFGTVNLDMRSLWINYEVSLFVYDEGFAKEIRQLQQSYLDDSLSLDIEAWKQRGFKQRFLENVFRLSSALL
ncbi:MAG: cardiolipin synthase [Arenicellales bacterium]